MLRLPNEPEESFLGAVLFGQPGPLGGLAAAERLYLALAPAGADPAAVRALCARDAQDWDWEARSKLSTAERLRGLLEPAYLGCLAQLQRAEPATVAEATSVGRLIVQLARLYEHLQATKPSSAETSADYAGLSDADLEALRGILDRARKP